MKIQTFNNVRRPHESHEWHCQHGIYVDQVKWPEIHAILKWCQETFGPQGLDNFTYSVRWTIHGQGEAIFFRDESDRTLFLMKWGGE